MTTRVSLVFNCSLPSLNQAAYPEIEILNSLFNVLKRFHLNRILLLSDIRESLLIIKPRYDAIVTSFTTSRASLSRLLGSFTSIS